VWHWRLNEGVMAKITEDTLEKLTLSWLCDLGYALVHGPDMPLDGLYAERSNYTEVILKTRLKAAISKLNPHLPIDAQEEVVRKLSQPETASLVSNNRAFHRMLRDGVSVAYKTSDDQTKNDLARIVDFANPDANDWLAVDQLVVLENNQHRRPDIVIFLNGLPVALFELKNALKENATIWSAFHQVQTYKAQIPSLLTYNEAVVISDGVNARIGSLTASQEWFKVWRTIDGGEQKAGELLPLQVLTQGVFEKKRFLDLLHHYTLFEDDGGNVNKVMAGYHQFHAVNVAIDEVVRASGLGGGGERKGDRKAGVVWHTQGSGKSYSMLFFAARVARHPAMKNPTIVVLTDRNDLDDQLFGQFLRCTEMLGQTPAHAESREHMRELLKVSSGGVVFTTIQKFLVEKGSKPPPISERENVVVIADEAHRSQYDLVDGLAASMRDALPKASFIGFTGTPIDKKDASTRAIFGEYISIYDIQRAVEDQATVPIYYESRVAKLSLNQSVLDQLDAEFEEITENEEADTKNKLKSKWSAVEAVVGEKKRLKLIARDLVEHFDRRQEAMVGKAMVVCMSRRICVELLQEMLKLRPEWASEANDDVESERKKKCIAKIIMTGSAADGAEWQQHIRNSDARRKLANRFKDTRDPFRIVIVRDMWLTGFDAPCMTTMYVDKPMQGHGLMQAIARVNRVFRDKPGGLVVDYLGLANQLKKAIATYTESGGAGEPTHDVNQALEALYKWHSVIAAMLHGSPWEKALAEAGQDGLKLIPAIQQHILQQEDGKGRFVAAVTKISQAFALCASTDEAKAMREQIAFFQGLQAILRKTLGERQKSPEELDAAVRQLVSKAIVADGEVIDVFTAAGLHKPNIGILSDKFLSEVRDLEHKNVAAELLEKLLREELKTRSKKNVVQARQLSEKLKTAINSYHNRSITVVELIERMIEMSKEVVDADKGGERLNLSSDEYAFYQALAANESAVQILGDQKLAVIATELVTKVRNSATIDWSLREQSKAGMRILIKRTLKRWGYPPDLEDAAVALVLDQAKVLCDEVVAEFH
jgi:type I restriction enzyme R subunit